MSVYFAHPRWRISCKTCETFLYSKDGDLWREPDGQPTKRLPGSPTPCLSCPKVPAWAKRQGKNWSECRSVADELSDANRSAFEFYSACKGVGSFPDDPLVLWYSGLIARVEADAAADAAEAGRNLLKGVLSVVLARVR